MSEMEWLDMFGDNLVYIMRRTRTTQRKLAEKTGLSQGTISKYINKQQLPGVRAIVKLAYALDCSTDDLIDLGEVID